jgi:hypothetical protein
VACGRRRSCSGGSRGRPRTRESLHGRALGVQELAIGIMPVASLVIGAFAEHYGVGSTTFVSAVLLVTAVAALGLWTPQLLRYSGRLR